MTRMYDVWRDWFVATDRAPRVFVIAAWIAMAVALFGYIYWFGRDVPYWEDWFHVPVLSGARPFDMSWIVQQLLEHRYVLSRLLLTPIWMLTHDFRAPMWIDAVALSASPIANRPRSCGLDRSSASFSRSVLSQRCGQVRLVGTPLLAHNRARGGRSAISSFWSWRH